MPFIYAFIKQRSQGVESPTLPTNGEVAQIKNLRKKVDHLKSLLGGDSSQSETEESD